MIGAAFFDYIVPDPPAAPGSFFVLPNWHREYDFGDVAHVDPEASNQIIVDKPGIYWGNLHLVAWLIYDSDFLSPQSQVGVNLQWSGGGEAALTPRWSGDWRASTDANYVSGTVSFTLQVHPEDIQEGRNSLRVALHVERDTLFIPDPWFYVVGRGDDWTWTFVRLLRICPTPKGGWSDPTPVPL